MISESFNLLLGHSKLIRILSNFKVNSDREIVGDELGLKGKAFVSSLELNISYYSSMDLVPAGLGRRRKKMITTNVTPAVVRKATLALNNTQIRPVSELASMAQRL